MKIIGIHERVNQSSTPYRLMKNLRERGVDFMLVTLQSSIVDENVIVIKPKLKEILLRKISTERKWHDNRKKYSIDRSIPFSYVTDKGIDVTNIKEVKEADIIQIHWIGSRFLSPANIKKIMKMGKPVIFVNHDSAHFTGGCHIRLGCEKYVSGCGTCEELHSMNEKDVTSELINKKANCVDKNRTFVISPSRWMNESSEKSIVFNGCKHRRIPNSVNTDLFCSVDKKQLRKKHDIDGEKIVILFGAVDAVNALHKGYKYLVEAIRIFVKSNDPSRFELIIFGSDGDGLSTMEGICVKYLGRCSEAQMIEAYNIADIYVFPSIDDNLPGTVLESSSCEVPVVAFVTGGVPDIIEHKLTGYLAEYKNSEDLANGIQWVIDNNIDNKLGKKAREKMLSEFSREIVGQQYIEFYEEIID